MNYRHAYHAGNFADVFKHIVLIMIVEAFAIKPKPFSYIDTHAGLGRYDLRCTEAVKTKEYQAGIGQLFNKQGLMPKPIKKYLNIIKTLNKRDELRYYPGSPRIVRQLIRPDDKMILSELHPLDAKILKKEFSQDKQVAVHLLDAYQCLKAFLPPTPRRGLVLIDPPYESVHEFISMTKALKSALKHWREGTYVMWYPVKNRYQIEQFERKLKNSDAQDVLMTEFNLYPDDSPLKLNGSGLAIINPPWQLDKKLNEVLLWLLRSLDVDQKGSYRIELL